MSTSVALCVGGFVSVLIAPIPEAVAQGCAMCYQNAAASGPQGRFALQHGVLILFVPAVGFFASILFLLYRRRHLAGPSFAPDASSVKVTSIATTSDSA
jgi:hypothetical protein